MCLQVNTHTHTHMGVVHAVLLCDNLSMPDFVVGARDPDTQNGEWQGAFVGGSQNGTLYMAFFKNRMDFIGKPSTRNEVLTAFEACLKRGWAQMTPLDIHNTAGIEMHEASRGTDNIV